MEKFRYWVDDKCRQWLWWKKSCYRCSYELLCLFQDNQERIWKDIAEQKKTSEKD